MPKFIEIYRNREQCTIPRANWDAGSPSMKKTPIHMPTMARILKNQNLHNYQISKYKQQKRETASKHSATVSRCVARISASVVRDIKLYRLQHKSDMVKRCLHYDTCMVYMYAVHVRCSVYTVAHVRRACATYRVRTSHMHAAQVWASPLTTVATKFFVGIMANRLLNSAFLHRNGL